MIIQLISKWNSAGVKKGEKDLDKFKKFAKGAAIAAGAAIGKMAVDAAMAYAEDEKAAKALERVLKNSGWGAYTDQVAAFIDKAQLATGVSDEQLRPAFTTLFNSLNDANLAQNGLNVALDVAAATGKDVTQVAAAMAKAANGNTGAISKLGVGFDKAWLKTASYSDIVQELTSKFGGSAADAANTYAGKLDRLKRAADEAQETIGKGLIDALTTLAGDGVNDIEKAQKAMQGLATETANVIRGIAAIYSGKTGNGFIDWLSTTGMKIYNLLTKQFEPVYWVLKALGKIGENAGPSSLEETFTNLSTTIGDLQGKLGLFTKAQKDEADRLKKLNEEKRKEALAREKAAKAAAKELAQKKLAAKYDLNLIGLEAAKKKTTSKDTLGRLVDLQTIALQSSGLTAAQAGMSTSRIPAPSVTVNVSGSVVTERDLLNTIQRQLLNTYLGNTSSRSGGWL